MYDFLLMEEWWMETIIAACITAGVTLLAAFLTWNYFMRKMSDDIKDIKGQVTGQKEEHRSLSESSKGISGECKELSREHQDIRDKVMQIISEQHQDKAAREEAGKHLPAEKDLLKLVEKVFEHNKQLVSENAQLRENIRQLEKQIEQVKQNKRTRQRPQSQDWEGDEQEP